MTTVYYSIGKKQFGEHVVSFWTKPDKKDLWKENFVIIEMDRLLFRVQRKLGIHNFELVEV